MKRKYFLLITFIGFLGLIWQNWQTIYVWGEHFFYSQLLRPYVSKHSQIQTFEWQSRALATKRQAKIYIPQGYGQSQSLLPAIYLLHGFPGSLDDWLINGNIQKTLDDLIISKKLPPSLVVFVDGIGPKVKDSQYIDSTAVNQHMETAFFELKTEILKRFLASNEQRFNAIAGISSGGYGAVNLALRHPSVFGQVVSISGYFDNKEYVAKELFGENDEERLANNPMDYIEALQPDKNTRLVLITGQDDFREFKNQAEDFSRLLEEKGWSYKQLEIDGGHNWLMWSEATTAAIKEVGSAWTAKNK